MGRAEMTRSISADPIKDLKRKRKLSEAQKLRTPASEETLRKMSAAKIGKKRPPVSDETRRKLIKASKGKHLGGGFQVRQ